MRISKNITVKKIIFLYLLSILYALPIGNKIGFIAMIIILTAPLLSMFISHKIKKKHMLLIVFFCLYYLLLLSKGNIVRVIYIYALQFLIISFVLFLPCFTCSTVDIRNFCKKCAKLANVLIIYNVILLFVSPKIGINYSTYPYALRDVMFGFFILSLFNKEYRKKKLYLRVFLHAILFFLLSERTMAIGLILFICCHFIISRLKSSRQLKIFFVLFSILLLVLPFIYVGISNSEFADTLDLVVQQYSGKRFFSGREELWHSAIKMIQDEPLFGHGFDDYYFIRSTRRMSVHNLYLYILLQGGIINLLLIMGFFYSIFNRLTKGEKNYNKKISMSLLLVCMFLADFGLILFANDILYSLFLWTGVGISMVNNTSDERIR